MLRNMSCKLSLMLICFCSASPVFAAAVYNHLPGGVSAYTPGLGEYGTFVPAKTTVHGIEQKPILDNDALIAIGTSVQNSTLCFFDGDQFQGGNYVKLYGTKKDNTITVECTLYNSKHQMTQNVLGILTYTPGVGYSLNGHKINANSYIEKFYNSFN